MSNGIIIFHYVFYVSHEAVNKRSYMNINQTDITFTKIENWVHFNGQFQHCYDG